MPFERASEEPYRRRPVDVLQLLVAVGAGALLVSVGRRDSAVENAVFSWVDRLPTTFDTLADALSDAATTWAVVLVAAAALWGRRWRLARDLSLAGGLAWLTARGVGLTIDNGLRLGLHATFHSRQSAAFPDVPMAVLTAVVGTAAPFTARTSRWVGRAALLLLAPAEMYSAGALPRSLLCALAVGTAASAFVHVAVGSPAGRPTTGQVEAALQQLGVLAVRDVRLAARQPRGYTLMLAEDASSPVVVKVLGRDERDARLANKLWRWLVYRTSGLPLFLTRVQEIEHQAYVMLLAERAGVRVAPLIAAGTAGPGAAVLAERRLVGTSLSELSPQALSEELLTDVWVQATQLHHAQVAHGQLTAANIMVDEDEATLVGFEQALAGATLEARTADVAQLLVVTSQLVGIERATAAALQTTGPESLERALPLLQPPVLSAGSRGQLGLSRSELNEHLDQLREHVAGELGTEPPPLQQLTRVTLAGSAFAIGLVAAFAVLLTAVGSPSALGHALAHAEPGPLVDAVLLTAASTLGFALALAGSTRYRLPLGSNLAVQWAALFSNAALPLGGQVVQVRYLQRRGVPTAEAVSAGGLVNLAGGIVGQLVVLGVALALAPRDITLVHIPQGAVTLALEAATAVLLLSALVFAVSAPARARIRESTRAAVRGLIEVLRSPRQAVLLVGGSALGYFLMSLALEAVLQSLGSGLAVAEAVALSTGVTLVAQVVPIPGGSGAASSVGLSGALIGVGVPHTVAVAAALLTQLITQYLPILPGWVATRVLLRRGDL